MATAPVARPVAPPPSSPPASAKLPATISATSGFANAGEPRGFTPAPGTVTASCRVAVDGELAFVMHPETIPRALAPCKAPGGARFVVEVEATVAAPVLRGVKLQEGATTKDAACVRGALLKAGIGFEAGQDEKPRLYDCYVAFF